MGIKRMGPPHELIKTLQKTFGIPNFVETGTFQAKTSVWASGVFSNVWTVENSKPIYEKNLVSVAPNYPSIRFMFGDTRKCLIDIKNEIKGDTLFWLDAHWCGGLTFGTEDPCPLMEELEILKDWPGKKYIFIDDARLFVSPPPTPHKVEMWPPINEITQALHQMDPTSYTIIQEDVIFNVPSEAKTALATYSIAVSDKELALETKEQAIKGRLKGLKMIADGLQVLIFKK